MNLGMSIWTLENKTTCRTIFGAQHPPARARRQLAAAQYFDVKYLAIHSNIELNYLGVFGLHLICSIRVYSATHFDALRVVRLTVHRTAAQPLPRDTILLAVQICRHMFLTTTRPDPMGIRTRYTQC